METMLFIRKPMETYRNQSQNFMGIKLIHVWYIPTVWCFWELSTGVFMEIKLIHVWAQTIHGTGIFTKSTADMQWKVQLTHPQAEKLLVCLMICTEPVLRRETLQLIDQQMTQLDVPTRRENSV